MRNYKRKDVHTCPNNAGADNLPPDFNKKNKDDTDSADSSAFLFRKALDNSRKYKGLWTVEQLQEEIENYFQYCADNSLKLSKVGVQLWLGMTRETYNQWERFPEKYGEKSDIVRWANSVIEGSYINRGEQYPTFNIFLLKTSHGYVEPNVLDITSNGKPVTNPEEVNDRISKLGLDKK